MRNLTLAYQGHPAVHHLSGSFEAGSLTAIVGPNGAGKSTTLKAISNLIRTEDGRNVELAQRLGRDAFGVDDQRDGKGTGDDGGVGAD